MKIEYLKGPKSETQYTNLRFHSKGGMGEVYLADDTVNGTEVAVKLIYIEEGDEPKLLESEIEIGLSLKHQNIVETFYSDTTVKDGTEIFYLTMEYHKGGSLRNLLQKQTGNLPLTECYRIMVDLASGLEYAHSKIVHRDLKPDNTLIGNDGRYKICDFGLAKYIDMRTRTHSLKGSGTYYYMAPECWTYDSNTISMDLYSLGILYFEILTKSLPFTGRNQIEIRDNHLFQTLPNLLDIRPNLPVRLVQLVGRLTNKRPSDRYSSASEVINVLDSLSIELGSNAKASDRLIHLANQTILQKQKIQLEQEKRAKELERKEKLVDHSTEILFAKFIEKIIEINSDLEQSKIDVQKSRRQLKISFQDKAVEFLFFSSSDIQVEIEKRIKASRDFQIKKWGTLVQDIEDPFLKKDFVALIGKAEFIQAYSRKPWGFNLILRKPDEKDLYGEWSVAWFEDSPLFSEKTSHQYALDVPEFYKEYEIGRRNTGMQRRFMVFKNLDDDVVDSTLEQILS